MWLATDKHVLRLKHGINLLSTTICDPGCRRLSLPTATAICLCDTHWPALAVDPRAHWHRAFLSCAYLFVGIRAHHMFWPGLFAIFWCSLRSRIASSFTQLRIFWLTLRAFWTVLSVFNATFTLSIIRLNISLFTHLSVLLWYKLQLCNSTPNNKEALANIFHSIPFALLSSHVPRHPQCPR
jgi:hypothetical protein